MTHLNLTPAFPQLTILRQENSGYRNGGVASYSVVLGEDANRVFALPLQVFGKPKSGESTFRLNANPYELGREEFGNGNRDYKLLTNA